MNANAEQGGLLAAIPGLAAHVVPVESVEPVVVEFDTKRAERLMSDAFSLVSSLYPVGSLDWLEKHRPDVKQGLKDVEDEVNVAALSGQMVLLERALQVWTAAHQKAFAIFEARPPVIEREGAV